MKVNVGRIAHDKGKSLAVDLEAQGEPFAVGGERVEFLSPVKVRARITNSGRCFVVEGHLAAKVELTCHRCLDRFVLDLEAPFEVEYFRSSGEPVTEELSARQRKDVKVVQPANDEETFLAENGLLFSGDEIDLTEPVREETAVVLPMKWLCREDCAGLCPVCGVNRNVQTCTCEIDTTDPRLAKLKGLLHVTEDPEAGKREV